MFKFLKKREDLEEILESLGKDFTPPADRIFRAAMPVERIKVVILGQDPYHQPGVATGRAFEVAGLKDWRQHFRQVSLKNIVRLLYASETGENPYEVTYTKVLREMDAGRFCLLPPDRLFSYWQAEGVLLFNTALTCKIGAPGTHAELWRPLCEDLLQYIEDSVHPIWFLWGTAARQYAHFRNVFLSRHPMLCADKWEDDFLKNPCFRQTADLVDWTGKKSGMHKSSSFAAY